MVPPSTLMLVEGTEYYIFLKSFFKLETKLSIAIIKNLKGLSYGMYLVLDDMHVRF
jgi:hypothetical protein